MAADLEVELADGAAEIGSVELAVHDVRKIDAERTPATRRYFEKVFRLFM